MFHRMGLPALCSIFLLTASVSAKKISVPVDRNYENGKNFDYAPGDTLLLEPGRRPLFHLKHFHGTADKRVVVMNDGGKVFIGKEHYYGFTIDSCSHLHVTGTGDPGSRHGIVVDGTAQGVGFGIGGLSTDIEVDHMEICSTAFAGIMAKQDFGGSPPTPVPVFEGLSIHDNYIHDVGGEGMYIGETKSPGMEFRRVRIYNNVVVRTGWDLFQIANAVEDIEVSNNVFYMGGLQNEKYHQNGIQLGDNTVGSYYNNIVMHAPANGFIVMGSGNIEIRNNYVEGFGSAMFIDNRDFTIENTSIRIDGNYFCGIDPESEFFGVYNELNSVEFGRNAIEGTNGIVRYSSGAGPDNVSFEDSTRGTVARISFADLQSDDYRLSDGSVYEGIGLIDETSSLSGRPVTRPAVGKDHYRLKNAGMFTLSGRKVEKGNSVGRFLSSGVFMEGGKGVRKIMVGDIP